VVLVVFVPALDLINVVARAGGQHFHVSWLPFLLDDVLHRDL